MTPSSQQASRPRGRLIIFLLVMAATSPTMLAGALMAVFSVHAREAADASSAVGMGRLRAYREVPIVGSEARRLVATAVEPRGIAGFEDRARGFEEILARQPLDGGVWAALSASRLAAGRDMASVEEALQLSGWSAPREAHVIQSRLAIELRLFPRLSPDLKNLAAADLALLDPRVPPAQANRFKALVAQWGEADRHDLSLRITRRYAANPNHLRRYGL